MKTKYFIFAASALVALASCSSDEYVGDNSPTLGQGDGSIQFSYTMPQNNTRADIYGDAAASLLGNNFYVMGTKGTEAGTSPSPTLVFDNYLVNNKANTAGTTESNTANWEYVGVTPGSGVYVNHVKLGSYSSQTIKYWDYSAAQYDFFAFSTGRSNAVSNTVLSGTGALTEGNIGVTAMKYGATLASNATAYTLYIPSINDLKEAYITDIKEVKNGDAYGKEVTLQFKNIGSKVRVALYETVPGYSVKDVKFYASTTTPTNPTAVGYATPSQNATLISSNAKGFTNKGQINVSFPYIGNGNDDEAAYDKADAVVIATDGVQTKLFGALTNQLVVRADKEDETSPTDKLYLGRTLTTASFAGSAIDATASTENAQFYQAVFPATSEYYSLTLRVDYTLVSTDGSKEVINVHGASAVVPSTYTQWKPNYAYTYIFKISDNTNGTTDYAKEGLFPITFDAVVAEATDASGEQKTITTVSTPSITTYQQNHDIEKNEYSKSATTPPTPATAKNIYVQVMDNSTLSSASLITGLTASNSLVYQLSEDVSEAEVMDALLMRKTAVGTVSTADVKGRNGLILTNMKTAIDNTVAAIVNGADDQPITVDPGTTGEIKIASLTAGKSYAYVYVSSPVTPSTGEVNQYEPISVAAKVAADRADDDFYTLSTSDISSGTTLDAAEAPNDAYLYFSVTTNGTGTTTYSYISSLGKTTMPKGCKKVLKTTLEGNATAKGSATPVAGTFYFDKFITNDGKYAVKVIKIVA